MKAESYKRTKAEGSFGEKKVIFEKACNKKNKELKGGEQGSLASSFKSEESSEATAEDI